jgi:hypothetical protein
MNIIGKGHTWTQAPLDGENWGLTQLYLRRPVDLVIDMNVYGDGRWGLGEKQEADKTRKKAAENNVPCIDLENYPIREVMELFDTDYFSSTVDYAIALALYRGHTEINLYGITMCDEYSKLINGCNFWCGVAKGRGVKIKVHGETTIMKTIDKKVYGYDWEQK